MSFSLILNNIQKHVPLEASEKSFFLGLLTQEAFPKKTCILRQDQPASHIYFVNSGLLRAFFINKDGKDSTIMFAISDWWITDMYAFMNQRPAMLSITLVQPSQTLKLSKPNFDKLVAEYPKFERFFRIIFQKAYIREQLRIIQNLSMTAEERYHQFLAKYPQIAQHITQKQLASYLGITPEFLSMIRSNIKYK